MADTTQQATAPGLEAKAQRIYEIPYAELSSHLQKVTRKRVAQDAAEDMLEALKFAEEVLKDQADRFHKDCRCQLCESCLQLVDKAIAKAEGR